MYIGLVISILVLAGVTALSWCLGLLDAWASQHRHVGELLRRTYRELTILGLVALVLFIIEQADAITSDVARLELEYIHIALFAIVATFVIYVSMMLVLSRRIGHRWRALEEEYLDFALYKQLKTDLAADQQALGITLEDTRQDAAVASGLQQKRQRAHLRRTTLQSMRDLANDASQSVRMVAGSTFLRAFCRSPARAVRYYRRVGVARFLEQRQRFLVRHADLLPPGFSFASYLTLCKQHVFIRLVDLGAITWLTLAWVLCTDLYLRSVWPWYRDTFTAVPVIVAISIFTCLLAGALLAKMRLVHWQILHSEFARIQVRRATVEAAETWDHIAQSLSMRSFGSFRIQPSAASGSRKVDAPLEAAAVPPVTRADVRSRAPAGAAQSLRFQTAPPPSPPASAGSSSGDRDRGLVPVMAGEGPGEASEMVLVPAAEAARHGRLPTLVEPAGEVEVQQLTDSEYREMHKRHLLEQRRLFWMGKPVLMWVPAQRIAASVSSSSPAHYRICHPLAIVQAQPAAAVLLSSRGCNRGEFSVNNDYGGKPHRFGLVGSSFKILIVSTIRVRHRALCFQLIVILWQDVTDSLADTLWTFLWLAAMIVVSVAMLYQIVPLYVLTIHVSDLVDVKLLAESVIRHERHKRRMAQFEAEAAGVRYRRRRRHEGYLRTRIALSFAWCAAMFRPGPHWEARTRAGLAWALSTNQAAVIVTMLVLIEIFFLAMLASTYIRQPGRAVMLSFTIAIVAVAALELALRIWAVGVKAYFSDPHNRWWNTLDVLIVIAAVVAVTIGFVYGGMQTNMTSGLENVRVTGAPLYVGALLAFRLLRGAFVGPPPPQPRPDAPGAALAPSHSRQRGASAYDEEGGLDLGQLSIQRGLSMVYPPSYVAGAGTDTWIGGNIGRTLSRNIGPSDRDARGSRRAIPLEFRQPPTGAGDLSLSQLQSPRAAAPSLSAGIAIESPGLPDVSASALAPIVEEGDMMEEAAIERTLSRAENGAVPPSPLAPVAAPGGLPSILEEPPIRSAESLRLSSMARGGFPPTEEQEQHASALEAYGLHGRHHYYGATEMAEDTELLEGLIRRAITVREQQPLTSLEGAEEAPLAVEGGQGEAEVGEEPETAGEGGLPGAVPSLADSSTLASGFGAGYRYQR